MRDLRRLERLVAASFAGNEVFLDQCAGIDDWPRLFDRAFEHGVAGLLSHRLDATDFPLPAAARDRAGQRFATDRLWHRRTAADLKRILDALEQNGVRAVVLKGLVLGERVYPQAMLRPAGDIDLLIDDTDRSPAEAALAGAGYSARPWQPHEMPPDHAVLFEHPGGGSVDLHHLASASFSATTVTGEMLERSISYHTEAGGRAWVLAPEDELLYLTVHAARHRFSRLGWLVDLRLFIERHPALSWEAVGARARSWQFQRSAAAAGALLQRRLQFDFPAPARAALGPDLRTRVALPLTALATDPARLTAGETTPAKTWRVFCDHTFRALLGEGTAANPGYWRRSMTKSAGRLLRAGMPTDRRV